MPRQFFIAPLICSGTAGVDRECAPKVNPQQVNYVAECNATDCLVLVTGDTTGATNDSQLVNLVGDNLETTISSLSNAVRNRIQNGLNNKSIPLTLTNYQTVREFIQALGAWFSPDFDIRRFWISD